MCSFSGDARGTARAVASAAGIRECVADAPPASKAEMIRRIQREGEKVVMMGDGVNDAPALAQADAGMPGLRDADRRSSPPA